MDYTCFDKADLHIHLNGAIPFKTISKIVNDQNTTLKESDYIINTPLNNLQEYFHPWEITRLLPKNKELFFIILEGIAQELSKDNVKYVELRNSILYISRLNEISYDEVIDWFIEGFTIIGKKYDIDMRLIISVRREYDEIEEYFKILNIIEKKGSNIFVGFDLTGNETSLTFEKWPSFFKEVKSKGYGITIHAGESWNEDNVLYAINECKTNRIGHGLAICSNERLLDLCRENDICIEVCLTSNLLTSSVLDLSNHPVIKFREFGVPYVICSDNPGIHNKNLSFEYNLFGNLIKNTNFVQEMYMTQLKYAFKNLKK